MSASPSCLLSDWEQAEPSTHTQIFCLDFHRRLSASQRRWDLGFCYKC